MEQKYRSSLESTEPERNAITTQMTPKTRDLRSLAGRGSIRRSCSALFASAAARNKLAKSKLSKEIPREAHSDLSFRVVESSIVAVLMGTSLDVGVDATADAGLRQQE